MTEIITELRKCAEDDQIRINVKDNEEYIMTIRNAYYRDPNDYIQGELGVDGHLENYYPRNHHATIKATQHKYEKKLHSPKLGIWDGEVDIMHEIMEYDWIILGEVIDVEHCKE